jgi:hypothetical protein
MSRALRGALAAAVASPRTAGTALCVEHLQELAGTHRRHLPRFARRTASWLSHGPARSALAVDGDPDAATRRHLRDLLPADGMLGGGAADWADTRLRLRALLQIDVCPLCLAAGQQERLYLGWLTETIRREPSALADDPGGMCPTHLADLAELTEPVGPWAVHRAHSQWQARLSMALVGSPRRVRGRLREAVREQPCLVCMAVDGSVSGQTTLLVAGLGGALRGDYEQATGLCVRHVAQLPFSGPVADLVRRVALGHLDVLIAELEEAARKTAWCARHEPSGPERTAWLRAAALLDGRVFVGGRPRVTTVADVDACGGTM